MSLRRWVPILLFAMPIHGKLIVQLEPQTTQQFELYVKQAEADLSARWGGQRSFLVTDEHAEDRKALANGEYVVRDMSDHGPKPVHEGLIHDWMGAMFIPGISVEKVLHVLQDFNGHKRIYPEVIDSRLLSRNGNDFSGYWRLERKNIITVVLDVKQDVHYREVQPRKWICQSYARDISEIDKYGKQDQHKFPADEGHGYIWRLYSYWSMEESGSGVVAECRTISLSRNIPPMLSWIIKPFVESMPKQALTSTLKETREAARLQ